MLAIALLLSVTLEFYSWMHSQDFKEWFSKAKVGDVYSYSEKWDCNTCSGTARKVSDTQMNVGPAVMCTTMACPWSNVVTVPEGK